MNKHSKNRGFTLVEILVVIGIIAILMVALSKVAAVVKTNAQKKATQGVMSLVVDALTALADSDPRKNTSGIRFADGHSHTFKDGDGNDDEKIIVCTVDLGRYPSSRGVVDKINDEFKLRYGEHDGQTCYILVDVWGMPLYYINTGNDNFPVIKSAGPDMVFQTADDIVSSEF